MIRFVVDVSLPPAWVDVFAKHGWAAVQWSAVGDPRAKDREVMAWAREHYRVFHLSLRQAATALGVSKSFLHAWRLSRRVV